MKSSDFPKIATIKDFLHKHLRALILYVVACCPSLTHAQTVGPSWIAAASLPGTRRPSPA